MELLNNMLYPSHVPFQCLCPLVVPLIITSSPERIIVSHGPWIYFATGKHAAIEERIKSAEDNATYSFALKLSTVATLLYKKCMTYNVLMICHVSKLFMCVIVGINYYNIV